MATSTSRPPRRDSRARLVKAATEVVARQGFHAASVDAIARRAGYSVGALYWNFKNKDELFLAVFDEHVSWFEQQLREATAGPDLGQGALDWLERSVRRPEQFLIFVEFWAYAVRKPKVRRAFAERLRQMREATAQALRDHTAADGQRSVAPELAAVIGLALGRGLAIEKLGDPDGVEEVPLAQLLAALTR